MKRTFIFVAAILGVTVGGWASGIFRKPNTSQAAPAAAGPQPRIEVPENNFDFGAIEAGQTGRRSFKIRNIGQADLTLQLGETTCKCTLAKLDQAVVPPGGETVIELEWSSEEPNERYVQGAQLKTNDPQRRRIDLRVEGRIRNRVGIWPQLAFFTDVPRNSKRSLHLNLYSQVYDDVKILNAKSSLAGASVRLIDALATETALPFEARFIRGLEIEYAAGGKPGPFTGTIAIEYEGRDREGKLNHGVHNLDFGGETSGDFSLQGRNVVDTLLNMGSFSQAEGAKSQAYLHYRGNAKDLKLSVDEVEPEFVQVRVGEAQQLSPTMARFPIEAIVPPGSPVVNLSSTAGGLGQVVLNTAHPDQPRVKLQLSLVVLP